MIVHTEGPTDAKIMLVGEAPGEDEARTGKPFVGRAGQTLNWLLSQSGVNRHECLVTNVFKERPPANRVNYFFQDSKLTVLKPQFTHYIQELKEEIKLYKPNIVICLGATALWALTQEKSISRLRGYIIPSRLVEGQKVISTYHPQAVNYDWKLHLIVIFDLKKALKHSMFPEIPEDKRQLIPNAPIEQFIEYCKDIYSKGYIPKICCDIETTQPKCHIKTFGFAHSKDFAISTKVLNGRYPALTFNEEKELWYWVAKVLEEKETIFQNAAFDVSVLAMNHGIITRNIITDTLLAGHCCFPELPRDLGFLASICLDVRPWKHTSNEDNSLYNAEDCANTFGIAESLLQNMKVMGVYDTFKFEMSELLPAMMLQMQGIPVSQSKKEELIQESERIIIETKNALDTLIGKDINYSSPKQLQQLLYIDMKLPVQYKRRKSVQEKKTITADAKALKRLKRAVPNNPLFDIILEHKKHIKLKSSFLEMEVSPNNTVHTSYNVTGSATDEEGRKSFGRWSSSKSIILPYGSGNLQNIPKIARKIYAAPEGCSFVEADYVQAEAVVVSYLINDRRAKTIFQNRLNAPMEEKSKYDIHRFTASMMFNVPEDDVTPEQRRIGKTIRHATNYDAGPVAIADTLGCTQKEAKLLKEVYHNTCPQLRLWYGQIQNQLRENRTLVNLFGRRHRFLERWGDSLFRSAYSYIPQSSVGDLLNQSLVYLYQKYGDIINITLQLHDAIYVIVKDEYIEDTMAKMKECMIRPVEVNREVMTIEVDFKVGKSWGELVEVQA